MTKFKDLLVMKYSFRSLLDRLPSEIGFQEVALYTKGDILFTQERFETLVNVITLQYYSQFHFATKNQPKENANV